MSFQKILFRKFLFGILIFLAIFLVCEFSIRALFSITKKDIKLFRPSFYNEARIASPTKLRFKSHPFLPYAPSPNDRRILSIFKPDLNKVLTYDIQNNSLGFRTPERPFEKEENTKRIVVVGGSTAWDGPTNEQTWPALLEVKLNDYYKDKQSFSANKQSFSPNKHYKPSLHSGLFSNENKIEVINLAVDGAPSAMSLAILNLIGVFYEPDLVISFDGVNDFSISGFSKVIPDYSNRIKPFNENIFLLQTFIPTFLYKSYLISITVNQLGPVLGQSVDIYSYINQYDDGRGTDTNTVENGLLLYLRNLRLMRAACLEYDCKFVASIPHWVKTTDELSNFDNHVRNFFKTKEINYFDFQNELPHDDFSIHSDRVHWTEKGLGLIADIWFEKITSEKLLGI